MTKYKLFPIDWIGPEPIVDNYKYVRVVDVGNRVRFRLSADRYEHYRLCGYTDNEQWIEATELAQAAFGGPGHAPYETEPCDHIGNRKFAIGRLEE